MVKKLSARLVTSARAEGTVRMLALLALTLGGAGLRLAFLFQPMVHDEAVTYVYFASRPLGFALSHYPFPNNHLLNTLLIKASVGIFGNSPAALRLPAFLAGVLLVPAAYIAIRSLYGRDAALLGTAFVAVSSTLVYYSVSARGYTMQAFIFMLAIALGARLLRRPGLAGWVGLGILVALGFYAVPTMLYFAAGLFIWLFIEGILREERDKPRRYYASLIGCVMGTAVLVVLLYLPVVVRNGINALSRGNTASLAPSELLKRLPPGLGALAIDWQAGMSWVVFGVLVAAFIVALVFHRKLGLQRSSLPLVLVATSLLTMLAQRVVPYARVWIPALPLFFGASAAGLLFTGSHALVLRPVNTVSYRERRCAGSFSFSPGATVVISLVVALALGTAVTVTRTPYQPASQLTLSEADRIASVLKSNLRLGDVIYLEPNIRKPLEYYCMRRGVKLTDFYGFEGFKPDPSSARRALVIDVRRKPYTLSRTFRYGHLPASGRARLKLIVDLTTSAVYELPDP